MTECINRVQCIIGAILFRNAAIRYPVLQRKNTSSKLFKNMPTKCLSSATRCPKYSVLNIQLLQCPMKEFRDMMKQFWLLIPQWFAMSDTGCAVILPRAGTGACRNLRETIVSVTRHLGHVGLLEARCFHSSRVVGELHVSYQNIAIFDFNTHTKYAQLNKFHHLFS